MSSPVPVPRPARLPLWKLALFAPVALGVGIVQALLRRAEMRRPSSAAIDAAQRVIDRGGRQ